MTSVVALFRYPLKSARGESLRAVDVERDGPRWDRAWACLDPADGTVGSGKHPRRWGRLLEVSVHVEESDGAGEVILAVAGRQAVAGTAEADALVSEHLGRPVRLSRVVPEQARLHRQVPDDPNLVPDWAVDWVPGRETVTEVVGARRGGRFVDFGAVHLMTTGALESLASEVERAGVDARRFRPNLVLDAPRDPEPGQQLCIGDVMLRILIPTARCVFPGLAPDGREPLDRALLTAVARHHRTTVPDLGQAACVGVYAEVLNPGRVEVGQAVEYAAGA